MPGQGSRTVPLQRWAGSSDSVCWTVRGLSRRPTDVGSASKNLQYWRGRVLSTASSMPASTSRTQSSARQKADWSPTISANADLQSRAATDTHALLKIASEEFQRGCENKDAHSDAEIRLQLPPRQHHVPVLVQLT